MPEQSQPKRITPQEFVERLLLKVKYKLAKLDAEFIEKARTVDSAGLLDLLEDHFVKRFDVWALASAPFAKSETCLGVHPAYLESLNAAKDRILFELSSETRSLPPDLHEELRARVVLRLTARSKRYWAEAGIILLNTANSVPYIVTDVVSTLEPEVLTWKAKLDLKADETKAGSAGPSALSETDRKVNEIVGEQNFRTLTNAEIMSTRGLRQRLREGVQLSPSTDATKSCLDRIRRAQGYPLSREIANRRSVQK
jgi:hypothetical protein